MNITIIHNPGAGGGAVKERELREVLEAAGHSVDYASTKSDDWKDSLQQPGDLVVAAGGDGTVAKVARRLVYREIPLAILPLGTANNLATSMGIEGDWRGLLEMIPRQHASPMDAGIAIGGWGGLLFLEGAGFGPVAAAIQRAGMEGESVGPPEDRLIHDLRRFAEVMEECPVRAVEIEIDGRAIGGDAFLVEVLNAGRIGPGLELAPSISSAGGLLQVVIAREEHRTQLRSHLRALVEGKSEPLELEVYSGRSIQITWPGDTMHVDDKLRSVAEGPMRTFFACVPGALWVIRPD